MSEWWNTTRRAALHCQESLLSEEKKKIQTISYFYAFKALVWWCQTFSDRSHLLQLSATPADEVSRATDIFIVNHAAYSQDSQKAALIGSFSLALLDFISSISKITTAKYYYYLRAQVNDFFSWIFPRLVVRNASAFSSVRCVHGQGVLAK